MFTVTATMSSNNSGASVIVVKGHGKQKTTKVNPALSTDRNFGEAAGNLLVTLLSDEQRSKVAHPSGAQRLTHEHLSDAGGKRRFTVNV